METAEVGLTVILKQLQDHLAPRLDSYEQMLYHYLFRHSFLEGHREVEVGIRSTRARVGMGIGKAGSPPSQARIAEKLRSLEKKGCVRILERSRTGTRLEVLLPHEIPGVVPEESASLSPADLEALDFFNDPALRPALVRREQGRCFYCLRRIAESSFTVDHVTAQADLAGGHSYRNVVACCFDCNSRKREGDVLGFLRELYREGLLGTNEHARRREAVDELRAGRLVPSVEPANPAMKLAIVSGARSLLP